MAIARVASRMDWAGAGADGYTSGTLDTTGANFLIVAAFTDDGAETITDSNSNTWVAGTASSYSNNFVRFHWAVNATVGTGHTISISGTDNFPATIFMAYSGVHATSPYDQHSEGQVPFSDSVACGSVTPGEDNELLITCVGSFGGTVSSVSTGFTRTDSLDNGDFGHGNIYVAHEIQTTATARNATWTYTDSRTLVTAIATFKAAAGGGGGATHPGWRSSRGGWF